MINNVMPGFSPMQASQMNAFQPTQEEERGAMPPPPPASTSSMNTPSTTENALSSLNSISQARATTSAGLSAAQSVSDLYSGLKGAMLTQGSAGMSSNDLISSYLSQLNDVIDTSKIEEISMVQQGNTLVVVITMEEGYWEENSLESASLDQDVANLADIDASTPEGFDAALGAVEDGLKNALKAIEMLREILDNLQEQEETSLESLAGDATESLDDITEILDALGDDVA